MTRHPALAPALLAALAIACTTAPETAPKPTELRPGGPTTAEITEQDLMTRLFIFADDSMQGRMTGTEGFARATAYIAAELQRLGLEPAGDEGSYFQTVPYGVRSFDVQEPLTLRGQRYEIGREVRLAITPWTPRDFGGGLVIYGGPAAEQLPAGLRTSTVVIALPGANPLQLAAPDGALARAAMVLYVVDDDPPSGLARFLQDSTIGFLSSLEAQGPMVGTITRAAAERMFGRPLASVQVGTELVGQPLNGLVTHVVRLLPAHNVVAVLPGSDPALRGQYVALGAHADHVGIRRGGPVDHDSLRAINAEEWRRRGMYPGAPRLGIEERQALRVNVDSLRRLRPARPDSIHNGADDDGSGSMALLEIAEAMALAPAKPRRSILFVWHTGEELGLRGANWFVENPTVPLDSIVAQVNIDMIGRGGAEDMRNGGPYYLSLLGSRRLSTELGDLVEAVNARQPRALDLDYSLDADGHPENLYCRSDHYHYARKGIPIVFFFTGLHGDYHQVTDEPQYIDYPHYARIVRFVHDVVAEVANRDQRPRVDRPVPPPGTPCRQ